MQLNYRFHFSKAIYSKVKNKFNLGAFFRPKSHHIQKLISFIIRQYMALPLLKPHHMKGEVERLGTELRKAVKDLAPCVIRRCNNLHNYIVRFWMRLHGPNNISVTGALHKTNNLSERL